MEVVVGGNIQDDSLCDGLTIHCGRGGIMGMGKDVCLWCGASRVRCAVVNLFMTHGRDKKVSERQLSDLCWSS